MMIYNRLEIKREGSVVKVKMNRWLAQHLGEREEFKLNVDNAHDMYHLNQILLYVAKAVSEGKLHVDIQEVK